MDNKRKPFVKNKNITWASDFEKEKYNELKLNKEKNYTPPFKKILIKKKENGFADILYLKVLLYLSAVIIFIICLILLKR